MNDHKIKSPHLRDNNFSTANCRKNEVEVTPVRKISYSREQVNMQVSKKDASL